MNCPDLTTQVFIAQFPEFADNEYIEIMISRALSWVDVHYCRLKRKQKQYVIFLLTAHLLAQQNAINNGDTTGGLQTSASIDKVNVSVAPAPFSDNFDYWLTQSRYGQELLGFLNIQTATPIYIGGSPVRIL